VKNIKFDLQDDGGRKLGYCGGEQAIHVTNIIFVGNHVEFSEMFETLYQTTQHLILQDGNLEEYVGCGIYEYTTPDFRIM
jgi:hypothetical protein